MPTHIIYIGHYFLPIAYVIFILTQRLVPVYYVSSIYTMKINVNNIFSESRDRTEFNRDNVWTCLGAIYKVEIDQRWIVLKEVVTIIKKR